jgi:hypothetical protein
VVRQPHTTLATFPAVQPTPVSPRPVTPPVPVPMQHWRTRRAFWIVLALGMQACPWHDPSDPDPGQIYKWHVASLQHK